MGDCYPPLGQLRLIYRYVEEIILPYGAYGPLLELLTDDNILVLTSLGKVLGEQLEEVAQTLLNIFQSQVSQLGAETSAALKKKITGRRERQSRSFRSS